MIDVELAIAAFKKKLNSMSYEERETYLKEKGFSFDGETTTERINTEVNSIQNIWDNINGWADSRKYFVAEILPILGYNIFTLVKAGQDVKIEKSKTIDNNFKIINCIYPDVDIKKMLELFDTNEEKIKFLVQCRELLEKYKLKEDYEEYQKTK